MKSIGSGGCSMVLRLVCTALLLTGQVAAHAQASQSPQANRPAQRQHASEAETRMRIMLLQKSMGFGGIFGGLIAPLNRPGTGRSGGAPAQKSCDYYSDNAACQAHRNGDDWAADRLQRQDSTPAERDWYDR